MSKTTPSPRVNVLDALPELVNHIAITIRLHPRRGDVPDPAASKIGGLFLWPEDEAWPTIPSRRPKWWPDLQHQKWDFPDGTPIELVPILQLNKKDLPDFPFPEGKDLFQLLWLPLFIENPPYQGFPYIFWRSTQSITKTLAEIPLSPHAEELLVPKPCILIFEHIQEFPYIDDLNEEQQVRLSQWLHSIVPHDYKDKLLESEGDVDALDDEIEILYQSELSVCPSNKLGGHVYWRQYNQWPKCDCGRKMAHLLTLADGEVGHSNWRRWLPLEDHEKWTEHKLANEIIDALYWSLGGGSMYYFICRHCETWPVKAVYQR